MDKQTLSNYGWIVIAILVLVIMIALATPFGTYISNAVKSTTQGLFNVQQKAMGVAGLVIDNQGFEETEQLKNSALNPTNINLGNERTIPQNGDTVESTDYNYTYSDSYGGWTVKVKDREQSSYEPIYESINEKPITSISHCFEECTNIVASPKIPDTVIYMNYTYCDSSLSIAPDIPSNVEQMQGAFLWSKIENCPDMRKAVNVIDMTEAFSCCFNLEEITNLPPNVQNLQDAFCDSNINTICELPESVTNINNAFSNTKLKQAPKIPQNVISAGDAFAGSDIEGIVYIPCSLYDKADPEQTLYNMCFDRYSELQMNIYHTDACNGTCGA